MLATRAVDAKRRKVKGSYGERQHNGDEERVVRRLVMTGKQAPSNSAVRFGSCAVAAEDGRDLHNKRDW